MIEADDRTLAALQVIHRVLIEEKWTIATAESLTAGMIAAELASQSGSSAYLRGGIVAYTLDTKVQLLGVDRDEAAACNCVSPEVAMAMAHGARKQFGADCVIAVTGYAEPHEGQDPAAHFVILCASAFITGTVLCSDLSRNEMRRRVTRHLLEALAEMLATPGWRKCLPC